MSLPTSEMARFVGLMFKRARDFLGRNSPALGGSREESAANKKKITRCSRAYVRNPKDLSQPRTRICGFSSGVQLAQKNSTYGSSGVTCDSAWYIRRRQVFMESGRGQGSGTSSRRTKMERQWPGMDFGRVQGDVQKHWAGIVNNLGLCIKEGQRVVARTGDAGGRKLKNDDVNRAISVFTGFIRQKVEEGRVNFLQGFQTFTRQQHSYGRSMFASISASSVEPTPLFQLAMSLDQVSKRLDGVPVYTVSNSANEFVLVSDLNSQKSLGIFCFREKDAEALLSQVRDREPSLGRGAKVVAVSLDKVYQLNTEGIAFRFLPDPHQVRNALETKVKPGDKGEKNKTFDGVPVFQSDNLILRSNNRRFCPLFFCKEDLERALTRAFKQQQRVNPSLQVNSNIQVGSLEDVLKRLESNDEDSGWGDIVFIPPGMDAFSHLGKAVAQGPKREETTFG